MPITPHEYAQRYLPVQCWTGQDRISVHVRKYHLGAPTAAKEKLRGALQAHFQAQKKANPRYKLELYIEGSLFTVNSYEEIAVPATWAFWGKGSPEQCQMTLQLALMLKVTTPAQLQTWADTNIGLDCNGFAGNYYFREWLGRPWTAKVDSKTGPSTTVDYLFKSAAGAKLAEALRSWNDFDGRRSYVVARVDASGKVIERFGPPIAHIALTQPQEWRGGLLANEPGGGSKGGYPSVLIVESSGIATGNGGNGVGETWMTIVRAGKHKGVFEVTRANNGSKIDYVRLAPLPADRTPRPVP